MTVITPMELAKLHHAGAALDVIDVRTPAEFAEVHLACARNVPLDRLNPAALPARTGSGPLYLICRSGGRGKQACQKLIDAGIADVVNVEGGTQACLATDLPVIRGAATMSLERQVRIAAGSLVVLGVVLGWQVHPALYGLSAFIGAGLVFAGITDTCGMGMLLARAPWNQRPASSCAMK